MESTNTDGARPQVKQQLPGEASLMPPVIRSAVRAWVTVNKGTGFKACKKPQAKMCCDNTQQDVSRPGLWFNGNKAARNKNNMVLLLNRKYPKNLGREKQRGSGINERRKPKLVKAKLGICRAGRGPGPSESWGWLVFWREFRRSAHQISIQTARY